MALVSTSSSTASNVPASIASLNAPLLGRAFSSLDRNKLGKCCMVSKTFNRAVHQFPELTTKLEDGKRAFQRQALQAYVGNRYESIAQRHLFQGPCRLPHNSHTMALTHYHLYCAAQGIKYLGSQGSIHLPALLSHLFDDSSGYLQGGSSGSVVLAEQRHRHLPAYVNFTEIVKSIPDSEIGRVYYHMWKIIGSPNRPNAGKHAFHDQHGLHSNRHQKVEALMRYLGEKAAEDPTAFQEAKGRQGA